MLFNLLSQWVLTQAGFLYQTLNSFNGFPPIVYTGDRQAGKSKSELASKRVSESAIILQSAPRLADLAQSVVYSSNTNWCISKGCRTSMRRAQSSRW